MRELVMWEKYGCYLIQDHDMHGGGPFTKYAALVKVTFFEGSKTTVVASFGFGLIVVTKEPLEIYFT
jgi:hypothetical protein